MHDRHARSQIARGVCWQISPSAHALVHRSPIGFAVRWSQHSRYDRAAAAYAADLWPASPPLVSWLKLLDLMEWIHKQIKDFSYFIRMYYTYISIRRLSLIVLCAMCAISDHRKGARNEAWTWLLADNPHRSALLIEAWRRGDVEEETIELTLSATSRDYQALSTQTFYFAFCLAKLIFIVFSHLFFLFFALRPQWLTTKWKSKQIR